VRLHRDRSGIGGESSKQQAAEDNTGRRQLTRRLTVSKADSRGCHNRKVERVHIRLRKTAFLRHLYIKTNILPRQARDKHRENSKKDAVFRTIDSIQAYITVPKMIITKSP